MKAATIRRIGILLILALVLGAVVWNTARDKSGIVMPIYANKTAAEWFFGKSGHPGREDTMKEARVAFAAMGTNVVPFLLGEVKTQETLYNRFYCWLHPKLPKAIQSRLQPPLKRPYIQMIALWHLRDLTPQLDCMAGEILPIVKTLKNNEIRLSAFEVVETLAIRLDDIEKKKAYFLSFLGDSEFQIQLEAAVMLSRIDDSLTNGLPILIQAVTNKNLVTQAITPRFPPPPSFNVPDQVQYRQDAAHEALRKVSPSLAEQFQVAR